MNRPVFYFPSACMFQPRQGTVFPGPVRSDARIWYTCIRYMCTIFSGTVLRHYRQKDPITGP